MNNTDFLYPANPSEVPPSVTDPSPGFKKEVSRVVGSIVLFFIVYLLMFLFSIGLVIACFIGGIAIITNLVSLWGIVGGVGLMGVGLMVFIFLVKFMFSVTRYDRSAIIEITEEQQPQLFGFIRQLAQDTQVSFPKKIYLSADVNACVFYDSSFWSMFLPVRKNLQVGLGLVNILNISEFKAVMAHEFGHFSQRSMKLGSFVYNVNKIIYNMLYENRSYASFLQSWANLGNIFSFFASVTAKIAQAIQAILKGMYGFINKGYMRLSREMEFHADSVAASVSGSRSLVTALRRVELADTGFNIVIQKCNDLLRQKKIFSNIYPNQTLVLQELSKEFNLPLENGLPVVNDEFLQQNKLSRINFKDQWASHPTTSEREQHLLQLDVKAEVVSDSAWKLFINKEVVQSELTKKIYQDAEINTETETIDEKVFKEKLHNDMQQFSFPEAYNGYYDRRQPAIPEKDWTAGENGYRSFQEIFSAENSALPKKINAATSDLEILKAIGDKRIQTKTFDFDGVKHEQKEAKIIVEKLELELKEMQTKLAKLDTHAMHFFYHRALHHANGKAVELKEAYSRYFDHRQKANASLNQMNEMLGGLQPIYAGQTIQVAEINVMIDDLKNDREPAFKADLETWLQAGAFDKEPDIKSKAERFVKTDYTYFTGKTFIDNQLIELNSLCNESWDCISQFLFIEFKKILEMQLEVSRN